MGDAMKKMTALSLLIISAATPAQAQLLTGADIDQCRIICSDPSQLPSAECAELCEQPLLIKDVKDPLPGEYIVIFKDGIGVQDPKPKK
jgi:hypothetical protein